MRSLGLIFALTGILRPALAQQEMPSCAAACLVSSLKAVPECAPTDIACICTNKPLNAAIQTCVGASCTIKEILTSTNVTMTMCGAPVRNNTRVLPLISGISGLFALVAVVVRCTAAGKNFALDDFFVAAAMAGVIPMDVMQLYTSAAGFGKDIWTVPFDNLYYILKLVYITQVLYYPVSAFTKLAFLFFYLRIFPSERFRIVLYVLIGLSVLYGVVFDFGMIFSTSPITYTWTRWDGEHTGRSIDINRFIYAGGGVNIALDVAILLAPIPELMKLTMGLKKKLAILSIFSVGGFTLIVSCIRLHKVAEFAKTTNATWDNIPSAYWSMLEINVGIFCVCMPAFRRFIARLLPAFPNSKSKESNNRRKDLEAGDSPSNSGASSRKRMKRSLGASLLQSDGTDTIDSVETSKKKDGESELELVHVTPQVRDRGRPSTNERTSTMRSRSQSPNSAKE